MTPDEEQDLLWALRELLLIIDGPGGANSIEDRKEFWRVVWRARDLLRRHPDPSSPREAFE